MSLGILTWRATPSPDSELCSPELSSLSAFLLLKMAVTGRQGSLRVCPESAPCLASLKGVTAQAPAA